MPHIFTKFECNLTFHEQTPKSGFCFRFLLHHPTPTLRWLPQKQTPKLGFWSRPFDRSPSPVNQANSEIRILVSTGPTTPIVAPRPLLVNRCSSPFDRSPSSVTLYPPPFARQPLLVALRPQPVTRRTLRPNSEIRI